MLSCLCENVQGTRAHQTFKMLLQQEHFLELSAAWTYFQCDGGYHEKSWGRYTARRFILLCTFLDRAIWAHYSLCALQTSSRHIFELIPSFIYHWVKLKCKLSTMKLIISHEKVLAFWCLIFLIARVGVMLPSTFSEDNSSD